MSNFNDEDDLNIKDKSDMDKLENREFETVPIEDSHSHSIEVFNVYKGIDLSRAKLKRKLNQVLLVVLVIAIIFLMFKILNISPIFNDDSEILNDDNFQDNNFDGPDFDHNEDDDDTIYDEYFYMDQKREKIDLRQLSSPQLKKPENIKLVNKLQISLNLEYDKFVHMKIKDAENSRWEVPEKEVLDKDYLLNKNDNLIEFSKYSKLLDSQYFYIEILSHEVNQTNETLPNDDLDEDNEDKDIDQKDKDEDFDEEEEDIGEGYGKKYNVEDFTFRLMTQENEEFFYFSTKNNFIYSDTYINFESKLTSDNIYGFGERTHDFKLNDGLYTIWPNDCGGTKYDNGLGGMNQYSHQPIAIHKTKFENLWLGFVFLNTNAQDVSIRHDTNNTYLTHKTIGGIIDYYIIVNDSPEEIVKNIQTLLGIPPLPPLWAFGNHQSRYGYKKGQDFIDVYDTYKKNQIPIDSMWLDIDALQKFQMFTLNDDFKNIVPYIKDTIHKDGTKFIPIVDIGFSDEKNNQYIELGNKLDIFIKSNYTKKNLIGKVWPGNTVFPDFFNPNIESFWNEGLSNYYKIIPYDGIWLDMNEPTNLQETGKCRGELISDDQCTKDKNMYFEEDLPYIPGYRKDLNKKLSEKSLSENAILYGNKTMYNVKPLISLLQTKQTFNYLNNNNQAIRPFVLSRSTTIGSGKYTYHWLGDNLSTFGNLKNSISGIFNFNIFGIPFTGSDICGFMENSSKDLCIRWYNLGTFYPFMRNHNFFNAKDQYPWSFGDDAMKIIHKDIQLRYTLIKYIYSQFFLISLNEKGAYFKPLMFEFPEDDASYENIEDKIMVGEGLLLCAFYDDNQNAKKFKFPNANFNSFPDGKSIVSHVADDNSNNNLEKNKVVELSGNLDVIHLFVRGGFILPYQDTNEKYIINTKQLRNEKINLIINIDDFKQSKGEIFYDNDETNTIEENKYYRVEMFFSEKKLTFNTFKNNLESYEYQDHILGKIELWRANEIFQMNDNNEQKTKMVMLNIKYSDNTKDENIEGIYDSTNDKIVFDLSKDNKTVSVFNISEITFN
jgi:alpha-glucosidase (family GH31 glycosyl hydrolase)